VTSPDNRSFPIESNLKRRINQDKVGLQTVINPEWDKNG